MEIRKILTEVRSARENLNFTNKSVTFFGSARFDEQNFYSIQAENLAYKLANLGYAIITGGGGGIMQAANKGAFESKKSPSVGFNIKLPFEQDINKYVTRSMVFSEFSSRKVALIYKSEIFVIFPGGFGTLDELFEVLVLIQVGFKKGKIYLFGREFWSPLSKFFEKSLLKNRAINSADTKLFGIYDSVDEILEDIIKSDK